VGIGRNKALFCGSGVTKPSSRDRA
jgi:hypothetical protein